MVPNAVARIAFGIATAKLLKTAFWTTESPSATPNHLTLKPSQAVTRRFVSLNANRTTTKIGR
jgi:hypothetical protein